MEKRILMPICESILSLVSHTASVVCFLLEQVEFIYHSGEPFYPILAGPGNQTKSTYGAYASYYIGEDWLIVVGDLFDRQGEQDPLLRSYISEDMSRPLSLLV
eukprot:6203679-Pleurochrysis_carterae.AAC.3